MHLCQTCPHSRYTYNYINTFISYILYNLSLQIIPAMIFHINAVNLHDV